MTFDKDFYEKDIVTRIQDTDTWYVFELKQDVFYITFGRPQPCIQHYLGDGVWARLNWEGIVTGYEIECFSAWYAKRDDFPLQQADARLAIKIVQRIEKENTHTYEIYGG